MQRYTPRAIRVHRVLTVTAWMLAIVGWGAFTYSSHATAVARMAVEEIAERADSQRMELKRTHEGNVADLRAKIHQLEQEVRLAASLVPQATPDVTQTGSVRSGASAYASRPHPNAPESRSTKRPRAIGDLLAE